MLGGMRYACVIVAACLLCVASSQSQDRVLLPLTPVDHTALVCGCTFRESLSGEPEGLDSSGPEIFVIAPNADPPHALANFGNGDLRLLPQAPIEFPMYQCDVGEPFESEWRESEFAVIAKLRVVRAGNEACWFSGTLGASTARGQAEIPVKGDCGC
jgi:hypothetical protein